VTATLLGSNTYGFADGNTGHSVNLGSSPNVGELDVLCVNSDTTVSTPSGFSVAPSNVGGQGTYVFRRIAVGGEGSTVTVTTSGNFDTTVSWSRWGSIHAADQATIDSASSAATTTPAHSTGALAETNELVVAFAALHNFPGSNPTAPVWSSGYTGLTAIVQGQVCGFVGYSLTAGTAADTPSVSWTNSAVDRDIGTLTFTTFTPSAPALPPVAPTRRRAFAAKVRRTQVRLPPGQGERPGRATAGRRPTRPLPIRRARQSAPPPPAAPVPMGWRRPRARPLPPVRRRRALVPLVGAAPPPAVNDWTFTAGTPSTGWHVRLADPVVAWTAGPVDIDWEAR